MSRPQRKSSQRLPAPLSREDAAVYDAHVVPRYSTLFGRLLLQEIPERERLQVLDVGCGSGYPALEVMRRLGEGGRVIAVDPDPTLIDLARRRALDATGRRIFFKTEGAEQLSFGDEVFDVVTGNLALSSFQQPERALAELVRVLASGGRLVLTQALEGTFEEVLDMFREVALKRGEDALVSRVDRIAGRYPAPSTLRAIVESAGFEDVTVRTEDFHLPFESASQVLTDPALRLIAVPEWRWIAGFDSDGSERLRQAEQHLDTYFGGGPLTLRVNAGVVTASV
ncbi:MAG: methyltransferase domain-containing protein [Sandaracinaceae bacterium]